MTHYKLDKLDVAALRKCDMISVHLDMTNANNTRVHLIKRIEKSPADPFAPDERVINLLAPVRMKYLYNRDTTRARCFALIYNYPSQHVPVSSILATLRVGDRIRCWPGKWMPMKRNAS